MAERTVAVVGGGIAGIGASYELAKAGYKVAIFEIGNRLGGNCFGIDIEDNAGKVHRVDAGVTDFNMDNFPSVRALVEEMGMPYKPIEQDASFMHPDGRTSWHTTADGPVFYDALEDEARFRQEIATFSTACVEILNDPAYATITLGQYLDEKGYGEEFRHLYLYPRAAGSFPMPDTPASDYWARGMVGFWNIHGIVGGKGKANRMVVEGGMYRYCEAFEGWLTAHGGQVFTRSRVVGVSRRFKAKTAGEAAKAQFARVRFKTRDDEHRTMRFDHVIFACGSNRVTPLLEDKQDGEDTIFPKFPYQRAVVYIHKDPALMPADRSAWSPYNYVLAEDGEPEIYPTITFYVNKLGGLSGVPDVLLTMNPHRDPDEDKVYAERFWVHPVLDGAGAGLSAKVEGLQGIKNTWFCGSYLREPFVHEPALASGLAIGKRVVQEDQSAGLAPAS